MDYKTTSNFSLVNSFLGSFPLAIYTLLIGLTGSTASAYPALFLAALFYAFRFFAKQKAFKFEYMALISFCILATLTLVTLLTQFTVLEHIMIIMLMLIMILSFLLVFQKKVFATLLKLKEEEVENRKTDDLDDFVYSCKIMIFISSTILCTLLYFEFSEVKTVLKTEQYLILPSIWLAAYSLILVRKRMLLSDMNQTVWLPIVNNKGAVKGRIEQHESEKLGNLHMHPVVRIAIVYQDFLYLANSTKLNDSKGVTLDLPIEFNLPFGVKLEKAIQEIRNKCTSVRCGCAPQYCFKYQHKDDLSNKLVYLYFLRVKSESELLFWTKKGDGKLWTHSQIKENIEKGLFDERFCEEYCMLMDFIGVCK